MIDGGGKQFETKLPKLNYMHHAVELVVLWHLNVTALSSLLDLNDQFFLN